MAEQTIKLLQCKKCGADPKLESRRHDGLTETRWICKCGQHSPWSAFEFAAVGEWQDLNVTI